MRPVTASVVIDAPRELVFEYLQDIASHAGFNDNYMKDFRLERQESRGVGAAARFRIESAFARIPILRPIATLWAELVISQVERPYRIVLEGRGGRNGRIPIGVAYRLTPYDHDMTRVEYTLDLDLQTRVDRLRGSLGGPSWLGYQSRKALRRLKRILEAEAAQRAGAARVAAG
jgi:uncharacterized protein YndB with AHSA1/START domain